jgi:hypothetical protein
VPSQKAEDAEFSALLDVIARYPGATMQVIVDYFMRFTGSASVERITNLARGRGVRIQIAGGVPTLEFQAPMIPDAQAAHAKRKAEGLDIWVGYHHVSPTVVVNFTSSLVFAQSNNYVWNDIIAARTEEAKFAERIVFDRPIGKNQVIQHPLAQRWMELEAANLMILKAAWLYDNDQSCAAEANAAKYLAGEAGFRAAKPLS